MSSFTDFLEEERKEKIEKINRRGAKAPSPKFKAEIFSRKLLKKLDDDDLLRLFMLYNVEIKKDTLGNILHITRPGFFPPESFYVKKVTLRRVLGTSDMTINKQALLLINIGRIMDEVKRRFFREG